AAQSLQACRTVLLVSVDDHLCVTARGEPVAARLEVGTQALEVVYLAVERHPDGAVLVGHRLPPTRQVDDAEPAVAKGYVTVEVDPLVVGAAVCEAGADPLQHRAIHRARPQVQDTGDPAHRSPGFKSGRVSLWTGPGTRARPGRSVWRPRGGRPEG